MQNDTTPTVAVSVIEIKSFAAMLKTGSQDLHDEAESGDFQRRMVDGALVRREFVAFLQQMWHVHRCLEPLYREAAEREPRFAAMLHEDHFRLSKIERDLYDLVADPVEAVLSSSSRFNAYTTTAVRANPLSLLGVLYVNEGATNGNKIIAKRLRDQLGIAPATAMRYLDPHGQDQRPRWRAFKEGLDELVLTADERAQCLAAARATFRLHMDLTQQLNDRELKTAGV